MFWTHGPQISTDKSNRNTYILEPCYAAAIVEWNFGIPGNKKIVTNSAYAIDERPNFREIKKRERNNYKHLNYLHTNKSPFFVSHYVSSKCISESVGPPNNSRNSNLGIVWEYFLGIFN